MATKPQFDILFCPHCGAEAMLLKNKFSNSAFPWRVTCVAKCCAVTTPWLATEGIAVAVWNRRLQRKPALGRKR